MNNDDEQVGWLVYGFVVLVAVVLFLWLGV